MLMTIGEKLAAIYARLATLLLDIARVQRYAEQSDRLHHDAISHLSQRVFGSPWPPCDK
jgi:hypothetical protein